MNNRGLPDDFFEYMKSTLNEDYDEYIENFVKEPFRGLRVNTIKCKNDDEMFAKMRIKYKKTPFCEHGYYIENSVSGIGNHPFHHAGAFYLQEPSAMSAVTALGVSHGDKVLDLCAAPGGKSTQIAAALDGTGLLVSNEIVNGRAKILCSNLERMGVTNAIVTNSRPDVLCDELCGFFDKVLVDAPCSGEGMIRREQAAVDEWKSDNHEMCAERSAKILDSAANAVRPGGVLVYSTCTLSAEENEQTIVSFIQRHPEFLLDEIEAKFGRPAYKDKCDNADIVKARRILYQDGGEGHFVARLKKSEDVPDECVADIVKNYDKSPIFNDFYKQNFTDEPECVHVFKDSVYLYPKITPIFKKTNIMRIGVFAGNIMKNRFEPSHGLYTSRKFELHKNIIDLDCDDDKIKSFLHGDVIECDKKGYSAVAVNGMVLGFGKASNGVLKNHYPKGLRIL